MGKRKRQKNEVATTAPPAKKLTTTPPKKQPIPHTPFLENPQGPHLKREVELYDKLSSEDDLEREEAAVAVISGLFSEDSVSEATLLRHLERRLFRGLASGRKGARLGFSVVITEILSQLFGKGNKKEKYVGLSPGRLLGVLTAKTKPEGDLSGQEEKDHHLGLLFGLQCFVRAKILFDNGDKSWNKVFELLIGLSKKKPWIREECGWVIVEALAQMDQATAEQTLVTIQKEGLGTSPEGVGIWLSARKLFPDMKFPDKPWGTSGNPLEHLKDLAKALKESSSPDDTKNGAQAKQTGTWNHQVHFVWNLVLDQYIQDAKKDESAQNSFENFWKVTVDENLFSDNASPERKFWGFLLFQRMLGETAQYPKLLERIFSPNLVRSLINHASKEDRYLHRAATKSLKTILQVSEEHRSAISVIITGIISGNGVYNFDRVTRSKTIEKMLSMTSDDVAVDVVKALLGPAINAKGEEEKDAESRRQLFGDYLLQLIRHTDISTSENSWVVNFGLPILADFAYSSKGHSKKCKPALTERTRTLFKTRLSSAFAHVLSNRKGFSYPCELLDKFTPDAITMDDDITAAKDKAVSTLEKLMKKTKKAGEKEKPSLQALALLFALEIFQLYNGESDALSILDELKICYDKLVRGKDTGDDIEASVVLVETLLSLVSRPSKLLKRTGQVVFEAFTEEITEEGLKLMTDVLESSESLKGQQELFDQDEDDEQGDSDDDDLDSDVEVVDVEEADAESDEDEDEESEDEMEVDGDDGALDAALEAALGTHRLDKDLNAEESDSDADMTDSEMLELDNKLVEIFKEKKKQPNKKKEKKDARENIVNFKSSILDLILIYVKKEPAKSFGLLLPLLETIRTTTSKEQVASKAHGAIMAFFTSAKDISTEKRKAQISDKKLLALLDAILNESSKDPSQAFAKSSSKAALTVASTIYRAEKDENMMNKIVDVYSKSIKDITTGKKLHVVIFMEWIDWCKNVADANMANN